MNEDKIGKIEGPESCRFFDSCFANLCPLDPKVRERLWCSEENNYDEICRNPEFRNLLFVRNQRRIGKTTKKNAQDRGDIFTYEMLNRKITVGSKITGITSDPPDTIKNTVKWYSDKQEQWILNHPPRKELSQEEIEIRKLIMKTIREKVKA